MPSRRAFIAALAVVFVPTMPFAAARRQRREEKLATVTLIIDGMT
jgi:hypothetical protein